MPEESHQLDSRERRCFWGNHIEQWQISELSQAAYCRKHRLKAHRFYYWRRRLSASQDGASFLPVALSSSLVPNHTTIRIHTPNGFIIDMLPVARG